MSELPNGWVLARLDELADLNPKQSFDDELSAGFVPMSHAPTNFLNKLRFDERPWGEIKKAYTNFKDGDVIFAKVTPCFENSKAAFVEDLPNGIGAGSSEFYVLRPSSVEVSAKYLLAAVKSLDFLRQGAANMTGAVGLRRVPKQFVAGYEVPVPPAHEQARIAQKLDELLAQVDTLKVRIDAIPVLLMRFRQSVLAAAVSGRLTEEWRPPSVPEACAEYKSVDVLEPWSHTIEAPASWQMHIFEEVIKLVGGSQPPKSEFAYEQKPGFVRLIQIRDYKSDSHKVFINQDATKKFCDKHDVMIGRYGPPIFQILRGLEGAYNVALMKAVPLKGLDNEYMYWYLQNYKLLNFVEAGSDRTAGQSGVNKAFLEKYPLFLPPFDEQTEIVHRVEQLFAFADQLEAKVQNAKERIDKLTQSILARAFRGELVPQDPNDEPASVLLERIKAQRAAEPKAKRGRKKAESA